MANTYEDLIKINISSANNMNEDVVQLNKSGLLTVCVLDALNSQQVQQRTFVEGYIPKSYLDSFLKYMDSQKNYYYDVYKFTAKCLFIDSEHIYTNRMRGKFNIRREQWKYIKNVGNGADYDFVDYKHIIIPQTIKIMVYGKDYGHGSSTKLLLNWLQTIKQPYKMLIIGLCGKFGSGKDYVGRNFILQYIKRYYPHLNVTVFNFADPLKLHVIDKYSYKWEEVYPPEGVSKSEEVRTVLQKEGDLMKEDDPNFWVKRYETQCKLLTQNGCNILITCDVRYINELSHIEFQNGLICKVNAPSRTYKTTDVSLMRHSSECALDSLVDGDYDYVFNNDKKLNTLDRAEKEFSPFFELLKRRVSLMCPTLH